jgi:hypothetical protein
VVGILVHIQFKDAPRRAQADADAADVADDMSVTSDSKDSQRSKL